MSEKFTPWFITSNGEHPVRSGVYNVSCKEEDQSGNWYAWIEVNEDGSCQCSRDWSFSVEKAERSKNDLTDYTYRGYLSSWRGIVKE